MITAIRILFLVIGCYSLDASAIVVSDNIIATLTAGKPMNLIVEYDDAEVQTAATTMRKSKHLAFDDHDILNYKSQQYLSLKNNIDASANAGKSAMSGDIDNLKEYSHLPVRFKRFHSYTALTRLLSQSGIKGVYENKQLHPVLASSLPLINQPVVAGAGEQGNGTTVVVIDTGVDIANPAFGACTAANTPSNNCRVVVSNDLVSPAFSDHSHGTNVSAIVLGVAPLSKVAMLNVFGSNGGAFDSDILTGINWAISNKSTYNIVAINLSLGDGQAYSSTCPSNSVGGAESSAIARAKNAGISVVVAAGNEARAAALSSPACAPDAISVGAVYDSNLGGVSTGVCTDNSTAPDQIACFSNRANYMTLFAPGVFVTAGDITESGTSQATPHVAGALAVLRSTFPSETLAQILTRLTSTGAPINFTSNAIAVTKPRINLLEAARPANNNFVNAVTLSGSSGVATGLSLLANKEVGEPNHAGNVGGASVWWKWVAPAAGQLTIDTHGSNYDTLLAMYKGASLSTMSEIASNDNDGTSGNVSGLLMQTVANQTYFFAVDGVNGVSGNPALNWSLNAAANANLSVSIAGPNSITLGGNNTYVMTVNNAGPQSATNVVATATLPTGASYVAGDSACSLSGSVVTCHLSSLAPNNLVTFNFQLIWNSFTTGTALASSVSSDVPDSSVTDNTGNLQLTLAPNNNGDVPLPLWATLIMGFGMLAASFLVKKNTSPY